MKDHSRLKDAEIAAEKSFLSPFVFPVFAATASATLGILSVLRGDEEAARTHYASLEHSRENIFGPGEMTVYRILRLLAQTMGNPGQAVIHFEDALTFCRKATYRPELAWTCCDFADTLLQRNDEGDQAHGTTLLDECLAISTELGVKPLMERAQSRIDKLKADS